MAPWRKITGRERMWEQHESIRGRNYTWWQVPVTTLTLECGHTKVYRGDGVPSKKVRCAACEPKEESCRPEPSAAAS